MYTMMKPSSSMSGDMPCPPDGNMGPMSGGPGGPGSGPPGGPNGPGGPPSGGLNGPGGSGPPPGGNGSGGPGGSSGPGGGPGGSDSGNGNMINGENMNAMKSSPANGPGTPREDGNGGGSGSGAGGGSSGGGGMSEFNMPGYGNNDDNVSVLSTSSLAANSKKHHSFRIRTNRQQSSRSRRVCKKRPNGLKKNQIIPITLCNETHFLLEIVEEKKQSKPFDLLAHSQQNRSAKESTQSDLKNNDPTER